MRPHRFTASLFTFALVAIAPAARAELLAAGPSGVVDESRPAKPNGLVDVHLFSGSLKIVGWNQNFVHVKGSIDSDCKVELTPAGDRTEVAVHCAEGPPDAELEVQVPQTGSVEVRSMSAPITVQGVSGIVRAHSVAGDLRIDGGAPTEIEARSTSGSIEIHANAAWTRAHTVSGVVTVSGAHGRASVHSVSGECSLSGGEFSEVSMQSVSGEIHFDGAVAAHGSFELQSHNGDVAMHVPASTSADFELRSYNGDLVVDHPSGRHQGSRSLDVRLGAGGAKVRAHSFSGDVTVDATKK